MPTRKPRRKRKIKVNSVSAVSWTPEEKARHYQGEADRQYARAEAYREAMLILTHQFPGVNAPPNAPRL